MAPRHVLTLEWGFHCIKTINLGDLHLWGEGNQAVVVKNYFDGYILVLELLHVEEKVKLSIKNF